MAVAFGGNHGHPVHRESRGEKRLREHGELYRSQMTKRSMGTKKLLLICLRTSWYPIADRQVNQNGEGDRARMHNGPHAPASIQPEHRCPRTHLQWRSPRPARHVAPH